MAYNKQTWKDEIPDLTKPIKDASGKQKTDPQTGRPLYELVQEGTRITSARLNHAEQGIEDAHILIEQLAQEWGGSFVASPTGTAGFQFTVSGLTVSWTAGVGYVAGRRFDVAAGSLTLNPTQGQYIYLDTDGVVKRTTSQTTANAGLLLWYFATDASKVITSTDRRRTITPDTFAKKEEVVLKEPGKGLSTNDYNNTEKAKVQEHGERLQYHDQRLTVIEDEMGEAAPIPATLKPGIQTITADRTTPFNVSGIKGRTLVNLLGRDGNCEDASKWDSWQSVLANDTENFTLGSKSLKITISGSNTVGTGGTKQAVPLKAGRYYIIISECKNGNATQVHAYLSGVTSTKSSLMANTTKFTTVYKAYNPTSDTNVTAVGEVRGTGGQYGYIDAIRLYEITAAEYAALDSMTPEQIAEKYPYVDDVKPIRNPYMILYGKNLLPPFTEWERWELNAGLDITIKSPYTASFAHNPSHNIFARYYVPCIPAEMYTLSYIANPSNATGYYYYTDKEKNRLNNATLYRGTSTAPLGAAFIEVVLKAIDGNNAAITGGATYDFVMLNIGDAALPFEPQNNDYVFYDTVLHSNADGTVRDELFYRDGQSRKLKRIEVPLLAGHLPWLFQTDFAGYKQVKCLINNGKTDSEQVIKHDGKIISHVYPTTGSDQSFLATDGYLYITISDTDSGWGENYKPSEDEIKAYFNGWKMGTVINGGVFEAGYNGSGIRGWMNLASAENQHNGVHSTDINYVSTTEAARTWTYNGKTVTHTPYRLIYQLAQPVEVPVTSEGKITLHEGTNVLEVGTGVVIRESVKPALSDTGKHYQLNNKLYMGNLFQYRTDTILRVYRNIDIDSRWMKFSDANSNGKEHAYITTENYNTTASYSVTYLVFDRYAFTTPLINLQGEYAKTVAGVLALEAQNAADVETRVSVAEMGLSTTRMLVDKILRGEISMGTDWSKQIPKAVEFRNPISPSTTYTLLDISGKGYLQNITLFAGAPGATGLGLYVDGNKLFDETREHQNINNSGDNLSGYTYSGIIRFNKTLKVLVRHNGTVNYWSTYAKILYSLDS